MKESWPMKMVPIHLACMIPIVRENNPTLPKQPKLFTDCSFTVLQKKTCSLNLPQILVSQMVLTVIYHGRIRLKKHLKQTKERVPKKKSLQGSLCLPCSWAIRWRGIRFFAAEGFCGAKKPAWNQEKKNLKIGQFWSKYHLPTTKFTGASC